MHGYHAVVAYLGSKGFGIVVASETLTVQPLHMAIDTFLFKTIAELLVLAQPKGVCCVVMEHVVVMAVPARIAGEVGCRVTRCGVAAGSRIPAVPGGDPFRQIDSCLGAIYPESKTVHVRASGAVTGKTDDGSVNRPPPDGVGPAAVACGIGAGLGKRVVRPSLLENDIAGFIGMKGCFEMRYLFHTARRKRLPCNMAPLADTGAIAITLLYGRGMALVTGEIGLRVPRM